MSLIEVGTPSAGPSGSPAAQRASDARAASSAYADSTRTNALAAPSRRSMASSEARVASTGESSPRRYAAVRSATDMAVASSVTGAPRRVGGNEPESLVDDIDQRLAVEEPMGVGDELACERVTPSNHVTGHVWRHHHPRCRPQRTVVGQRLGAEHVERRGGDTARGECVEKCLLVHDLATSDVDQMRCRLHRRQDGGVHQPARLLGQRCGDHDVICPTDVLREVRALDDLTELGVTVACTPARTSYLHADGGQQPRRLSPDRTGADDERGLPDDRLCLSVLPTTLELVIVTGVEVLREREDPGEHELGDRSVEDPPSIRHDDLGLAELV